MNTTTTATQTAVVTKARRADRHMVSCRCGTFATDLDANTLFQFTAYTGDFGACWTCRKAWKVTLVRGKLKPDHKCDARCTGAKGGNCECECGGKNHGCNRL